jgi:multisubunit Na+/H+ antiporter MnhC subunit
MDPSEIISSVVSFAQNNTVIAIILALGLLYFVYRKPKLFFIILFLGLFLYGLFYMITSMGGSGAAQKKKIIQQEEKQAD